VTRDGQFVEFLQLYRPGIRDKTVLCVNSLSNIVERSNSHTEPN